MLTFKLKTYNKDPILTENIFLIIKQVELIEKKEFAIVILDLKHKTFLVYVTVLNIDLYNKVHLSKKTQIAYLKANKAPIKVFNKYANFADIFSSKLAIKFLKYTKINNYPIKLVDDQ